MANPYLSKENSVLRLIDENMHHGSLIIGCDFDDTIFDLHEQGWEDDDIIPLLKRCSDAGHVLCMWTAVTDEYQLAYKKHIAKNFGIKFDYFNESPALNASRKPHFSLLLDDRAGLALAVDILSETLDRLEE